MAICPSCGSKVLSPLKTLSVFGDLDRNKTFNENKVGIYQCSHCNAKFPFTTSTQKLEMVKHDYLFKLRKEYEDVRKINVELTARKSFLEEENHGLKERIEILKLQGTAEALGREVSALRQGKAVLQEQISIFTPS